MRPLSVVGIVSTRAHSRSLVSIVSAGAVTWVLVSGPRACTATDSDRVEAAIAVPKRNGQQQHRRTKRPTCLCIRIHVILNCQSSLREKAHRLSSALWAGRGARRGGRGPALGGGGCRNFAFSITRAPIRLLQPSKKSHPLIYEPKKAQRRGRGAVRAKRTEPPARKPRGPLS
eukprot:5512567-Prymnesium_polylepis.1